MRRSAITPATPIIKTPYKDSNPDPLVRSQGFYPIELYGVILAVPPGLEPEISLSKSDMLTNYITEQYI